MKRTLQEIMDMPEFNLFLNPQEMSFFVPKKKECDALVEMVMVKAEDALQRSLSPEVREQEINAHEKSIDEGTRINQEIQKCLDRMREISEFIFKHEKDMSSQEADDLNKEADELTEKVNLLMTQFNEISAKNEEVGLRLANNDAFITHLYGEVTKSVIRDNSKVVSTDSYVLFQAMLAKKYYNLIRQVEDGKHVGHDEFCFDNGTIISMDGPVIFTNDNREYPMYSIEDVKAMLVETMLKANMILQENSVYKNRPLSISGIYQARGQKNEGKTSREKETTQTLEQYVKSQAFISSLNPEKIAEYMQKGYIKKNDIIKILKRGSLPEEIVVELISKQLVSEIDALKAMKVSSVRELVTKRNFNLESAIMLYSYGKLSISELEKLFKDKDDAKMPKENFWKKIAGQYKENINKISELITHNVLDFTASMDFLEALEEEYMISPSQKDYLVNIMNDFKDDELVNITENGTWESGGGKSEYTHVPRLTIDPDKRKAYLKSVGDVKELNIKGSPLIKDDSEEKSKKNSLDGYQLVILPDKKVAILEKFYEVERDKDDNLVYKRDKDGKLIPAIENATYIIPIGMARDFATKRNKQQLINSRFVRRAAHTMNWVENVESKIRDLNPEAEFDKRNTDRWAKIISDNYKKNKAQR